MAPKPPEFFRTKHLEAFSRELQRADGVLQRILQRCEDEGAEGLYISGGPSMRYALERMQGFIFSAEKSIFRLESGKPIRGDASGDEAEDKAEEDAE